jgi:hypothetical protein
MTTAEPRWQPRAVCPELGCTNQEHSAGGLCNTHYSRWWKYGTTKLPKRLSGRDLLYASIEIVEDCWLWVGLVADSGYGRLNNDYAHRVSYREFVGPIPDDLHIDHVKKRGCLSRLCINPSHLEAVTQQENNRRNTEETCRNGHSWTKENTYVSPDGRRFCVACRIARVHRRTQGRDVPGVPVGGLLQM